MKYSHRQIEQKWQGYWQKCESFRTRDLHTSKKFILDMFPYPSGPGLHVGHVRGWTASDVITRMYRMQHYTVFHPMGWDGFGLPAEQYANQTQRNPAEFTDFNINKFRNQILRFGFSYDFNYEINTTDPDYFRWTQLMFVWMFEAKLAQRAVQKVNYCPQLGTVLANEEVKLDHQTLVSERGGYPVIIKHNEQWVIKITAYADQLLAGLKQLDWPATTKKLQANWIGLSHGFEVAITLTAVNSSTQYQVWGFIHKPTDLKLVTFVALDVDHPLLQTELKTTLDLPARQFIGKYQNITDIIRANSQLITPSGVKLAWTATHPLTNQKLSVWVVNYLSSMSDRRVWLGMPSLCKKDDQFADQHHITSVVPSEQLPSIRPELRPARYLHLRNWIFSRQRFWGEPIPIFYRLSRPKQPVPVPADKLPVRLPRWQPKLNLPPVISQAAAPLSRYDEWMKVYHRTQLIGYRETNTMPQWAGSSWYYLAYVLRDKNNGYIDPRSAEGQRRIKRWMPVDIYVGGQEHATSHLLYARFWNRFLFNRKITRNPEPFRHLFHQGMILASNGKKMSKSTGNMVSVDQVLMSHGADAVRLCCLFLGPLKADIAWSRTTLDACRRWLDRIYELVMSHGHFTTNPNAVLDQASNKMVQSVTVKLEKWHFNTAISDLMVFVNRCYEQKHSINRHCFANFLKILSTFVPHLAQELWSKLDYISDLTWEKWPTVNLKVAPHVIVKMPVQINNRTKWVLEVPSGLTRTAIINRIRVNKKLQPYLQTAKKVIVVPDRIVNILV